MDTEPWSGDRKPDSRLNTVVLPAPLGPIMPRISFWFSVSDTSLVARRPPKLLNSLSALSTGWPAAAGPAGRACCGGVAGRRGAPR